MTHQQNIAHSRKSLLIFAERYGISKACTVFRVSRTTFYKIKKQLITTGSVEPIIRRNPKMPNKTALNKKKILLNIVREHPSWGIARYSYEFKQKGVYFEKSCIWKCLKRFNLNTKYKRLVYIEALHIKDQPITERTLSAIKHKLAKIHRGLWPGHKIGLDTFYVGNLKGVGRVYQVTGIDICSRYGWADLYTVKDQTSTVHFMEECLIPKFFYNGVTLESIVTDNGGEFIGTKFGNVLKDYGITHYRITRGKPLLNGYCERFQRTIYEEFYQVVFRKRFFDNLEELKKALQDYLVYYNFKRPHFGLHKNGIIPIEAFKAKDTVLRQLFQKV